MKTDNLSHLKIALKNILRSYIFEYFLLQKLVLINPNRPQMFRQACLLGTNHYVPGRGANWLHCRLQGLNFNAIIQHRACRASGKKQHEI